MSNNPQLQPQERMCLVYLAECGDEHVPGFDSIADHCRISISSARRAVRRLKRRGMVELTPLYREDDGMLAGSGYILTTIGLIAADAARQASK